MLADTQLKTEVSHLPNREISPPQIQSIAYLGSETIDPLEHFEINAAIIKVTDTDGSDLYLPAFQERSFGGMTTPLPEVDSLSLSSTQVERLQAANDQNINPLLATHLALNTDIPMADFATYASDFTPDIISFYGLSNALKSKSLAILHHVMNVPVFSFDSFSARGLDSYLKKINQMPTDANLSLLLDSISTVEVSETPQKLTFRETLNKFLEFTRQNPDYLYFIDLPGVSPSRSNADIYDIAAHWSTNAFELIRRSPDDTEINVVFDYFDQARTMGPAAQVSSEARNVTFKNRIKDLEK